MSLTQGKKKLILLVVGVAIFAALLYKLDFNATANTLRNVHFTYLFYAVALVTVNQILGYAKWRVMYGVTAGKGAQPLLPIFCSVLVGGMITPARTGDIIASLSWKGLRGKVLAWSLFHRISEGVTTIVLAFFILGIYFQEQLQAVQSWLVFIVFSFIVCGIFLLLHRPSGLVIFSFLRRVLNIFSRFEGVEKVQKLEGKIEEQIHQFYDAMEQFQKSHVLWKLVLLTSGNRIVIILVNITILASLDIFLPWTSVLGILAVTWVSYFFAPTPGGIGIGDIAPGLMLAGMGYGESAGGFVVLNRLFELCVIFFWAIAGSVALKLQTPGSVNDASHS